jgi:hypothetical protein
MIVRIYTGEDGQSHFEDIDGPWVEDDHGREHTPWQDVTQLRLSRYPAGYFRTWHVGLHRHYAIILSGQVECVVGDGTIRRLGPGDVLLEEDLTGQGHTTRVVSAQPALAAFVHI